MSLVNLQESQNMWQAIEKFGKEDSNINEVCNSVLCKYSKIAIM